MGMILPPAETTFFDANGNPLSLGSVYFYVPGGTTTKATYQNATQTISNTQPVPLDAAGRAIIFGTGAYRQVVYDALGNLVWDQLTYSADPDASALDPTIQYLHGDGATTTFTLSTDVGTDSNNVEVYIRSQNNLASNSWAGRVFPNAYSVAGASITFVTAPDNGIDPGTGVQFNNIMVLLPNSSVASAVAAAVAAADAAEEAEAGAIAANTALKYVFNSSVVMADPGTGKLRLNNATISAATAVAVSALTDDSGNPDLSSWIATWSSTSQNPKSNLGINDATHSAVRALYGVNGAVVDNGTWLQIPVNYLGGNGASFTLADILYIGDQLNGSNGSGTVNSVAAANGTITVGGTATDPTIARAAITGDVAVPGASNTSTIGNNAVTLAKLVAATAASVLLGRQSGGAGNFQEIALGTGLSMSGTTLNNTSTYSINEQLFTGSGTWSKPVSGTIALIECWGGGGGGGGGESADGRGGGGGGGGTYSYLYKLISALGATETVTIGAAGAAGVTGASAPTAGGAGGNTTFGAWLTAYGGGGGGAGVGVASGGGGGGGGTPFGAGASATTTNGAAAGTGGGAAGAPGADSALGGGGGNSTGTAATAAGGFACIGGGGAGAGTNAGSGTAGRGGYSFGGGGGGGGGANTGTAGVAGSSVLSGAGGAGASGAGAATAGVAPAGGGGGGGTTSNGGVGGAGQCRVTVW